MRDLLWLVARSARAIAATALVSALPPALVVLCGGGLALAFGILATLLHEEGAIIVTRPIRFRASNRSA